MQNSYYVYGILNDQKGKMATLQGVCRYVSMVITHGSLKMTGAGTFIMISRVVVVRYLGGLLCAVGPMSSLFNLSSLHPWES